MKEPNIILIIFLISFFSVALFFYPQMPEVLSIHWDSNGVPNGFMPKDIGLFFFPVFALLLLPLYFVIPLIKPYRNNKYFKENFDMFIILFMLFIFYLYILLIMKNLYPNFDFYSILSPGIAIFFYFTGFLIDNRNFFIIPSKRDIRSLGSWLFQFSALLFVFAFFFSKLLWWFTFCTLVVFFIYLVVFFYRFHHPESNKKPLNF